MTMYEFKKYLDFAIEQKKKLIDELERKYKRSMRSSGKAWLLCQQYILKELEDIRKVINK